MDAPKSGNMPPKCNAITAKGTHCTRNACRGGLCSTHAPTYVPDPLYNSQCITITFSDVVENGIGMQKIGQRRDPSTNFPVSRLIALHEQIVGSELIDLNLPKELVTGNNQPEGACLLIVRNYLKHPQDTFNELIVLEWDKKALFRGQVKNKNARHNLCFADTIQKADFEKGKGTIVPFKQLPLLRGIRTDLRKLLDEDNFYAEGNLYYNVTKCGIGYHGDTERSIVIGLRLGETMDLVHQWYYQTEPVGKKHIITLHSGDLYIMSNKAVGQDWKKRSTYTLRHAAGCTKYTGV